jgi:glucan endo-1,3-alpha-glucosidase
MNIKLIFFLALACLLSAAPVQLRAQAANRVVVAHWIVPMGYLQNEDPGSALQDDIRAATELGIDGFALDVFSGSQAQSLFRAFISAADSIGATNFKFFLSADMAFQFSADDMVATIKTFGGNEHYLKINGKPLLSTYGGSNLGDAWWRDKVLTPLKNAGMPVTFVPYFDRHNPNGDQPIYSVWKSTIQQFPSVDGLFNFLIAGSTPFYSTDSNIGIHWWSVLEADEALAQALHDSGELYMASYLPYYWAVCHPVRQYMEYQGGRGMDNMWTSFVLKQHPEIVQLVTWNDYSESTFVQPTRVPNTKSPGIPSMPHLGYYELLKYYVSWYHIGQMPVITKDAIFFFYRTHLKDAVASADLSACNLGPIPSSQKWGNIQDVIYVTTALTQPAQLVVQWGNNTQTYNVPAGLQTTDVPFMAGTPTFSLLRGATKLTSIVGHQIAANPTVYNFNVYSGFSIVNGPSSDTWLPSTHQNFASSPDWFDNAVRPLAPSSISVK